MLTYYIQPQVDPMTRTLKVRLDATNDKKWLQDKRSMRSSN